LAYNIAVVLWGGLVRATGSGAGCGNHWPLCNGQVTPRSPETATLIEFAHRTTSALDLMLVAALVIWIFRAFPRRHPARLGASLSAFFLVTEALIGAALVLWEHTARNASAARGWSLSLHLLNTLALLACLALTAWWAGGRPGIRARGPEAWTAALSLAAFALTGVSGAIAALGDTLFPPHSLAGALAQDMDAAASIFVRLRVFHPLIAAAAGAWLLYYTTRCARRRPDVRALAWATAALVFAQFVAGMINIALLAPVWMQIVHLLAADAVWIALVLLCASMLAVKAPAASLR
jgi:heme A synthase